MTGVFLSVPRYNWCAPLSHPSPCMLVNHGPSQQSSKEEYKPWKWGAIARYYAFHTKTMLSTRKSMPRSSRQLDHTKTWMVRRRKLQWYVHVSRSSGLAKIILQGTVKGGRIKGRQRKRWEDNIREWTGLEFAKSQRAVENREKWRKLLSVVPQRPSRLKDRWWWWWSWLHVKVTAVSNSFNWKFHVLTWLSWNFVWLLITSSRPWISLVLIFTSVQGR